MANSSQAFEFVKGATTPMIIGNAVAVGAAIIIVSLLSHDRLKARKGTDKIANTFQRWLLVCIVIANMDFWHLGRCSYQCKDTNLKAIHNFICLTRFASLVVLTNAKILI